MGKRIHRKEKGKPPPKSPSGNRDDKEVADRQVQKSMRLAKSSPPANSVPTNDNSSAAIVASGDIEEKNSKESNNDFISDIITDVPNKDLFTIDNPGNTTRVFPSQSFPKCQENFRYGLKRDIKCTDCCSHWLTLKSQCKIDMMLSRQQFNNLRGLCLQHHVIHMVTIMIERSHQSMPPKKNTPIQEL
jgi:hypothetical protein